jgi:hypothetical protein
MLTSSSGHERSWVKSLKSGLIRLSVLIKFNDGQDLVSCYVFSATANLAEKKTFILEQFTVKCEGQGTFNSHVTVQDGRFHVCCHL